MKNIVHGILRLLVALAYVYTLYRSALTLIRFGVSPLNSGVMLSVYVLVILLSLCVVVYMGVNCVREFLQKQIKLRALYVITAILTLISLFGATMRLIGAYGRRPIHVADMISYVTLALMIYFTVVDFIELFIKKAEKKFYTDSDFQAADEQ